MKARKILFSFFAITLMLFAMCASVFADETTANVSTQAELKAAFENTTITKIILDSDITFSGEWVPASIAEGRTLTINGNSHTITNMTVRNYLRDADGSGIAGNGSSCDYRAGFIGENLGTLTINKLNFNNADVDTDPLSANSTGSSQISIVCGYNQGTLTLNNINVDSSSVKGYTKVGTLVGHAARYGTVAIKKSSIKNTAVTLEADGNEPQAAFAGVIVGYDSYNTTTLAGIKIENSSAVRDNSVAWEGYTIEKEGNMEYAIKDDEKWGLICQTYSTTSYNTQEIDFEANVDGYLCDKLSNAFDVVDANGTITLLSDADLSTSVRISKNMSLDLNGNTLTSTGSPNAFNLQAGNFTLKDSNTQKGKLIATNEAFRIVGKITHGELTIESGVNVISEQDCCVFIYGNGAKVTTEGNLTSKGVYATIQGNGSMNNGGIEVYIKGGKVTSEQAAAIYFPNTAILEITGGYLDGRTVVYQKSGKLIISGDPIFEAFGDKEEYRYHNSSCYPTGDAIVVDSCGYPGGTPEVTITGGYFKSKNAKAVASYVYEENEEVTGFISGGYFSSDPTELLATGKVAVASDKSDYLYMVADKNNKIEVDVALAETTSSVTNNTELELNGNLTFDDNVIASEASSLLNNSSVIDSEEAMEAARELPEYVSGETTVKVVVEPYMELEIKGFEDGENKSLTVDITPRYNLVVVIEKDGELVSEDATTTIASGEKLKITKPITISIPLPEGFAQAGDIVYVYHKNYVYEATVEQTNDGLVATFTNPHGFSEFVVKTEFEAVATNVDTEENYVSLKAAIDEVKKDESILLLKDCGETVTVNRVIRFTFDQGEYEFSGDILPGRSVVRTKTEKDTVVVYEFTRKQSSGGSGGSTVYTVTFETNGGTEIEKVKVEKGETLDKPATPEKEGYKFEGWYTDNKCTESYDFDSKVKQSFTLYAKWSEVEVKWENPFEDVKEPQWFYGAVKFANERGLFNGMSSTKFEPDFSMTRAMLVTVLYRYAGEPEVTGESKFIDVAKQSYYEKAVIWAEKNGIVNGVTELEFAPDMPITREQFVTILYRFANYMGRDTSVGEDTNILSYDDFFAISEYAIPATQWAVGEGIIKGKTVGTLNPQDTATRAEVATILQRYID